MVINSEARRMVLPLGKPLFEPSAPAAPGPAMVERPVIEREFGRREGM